MSATAIALATTTAVAVSSSIDSDNAKTTECVNFMNNFNPKWDITSKQHYAECVEFIYPEQNFYSDGAFIFGMMFFVIVLVAIWRYW